MNNQGWTPLHFCAKSGNISNTTQLLATGGADIDAQTTTYFGGVFPRSTALHIAAQFNHVELAQLLIANGCNVEARDVNGYILI